MKTIFHTSREVWYVVKWMLLIAGCLILGGTFSFGIIVAVAGVITGRQSLDPVWMVGMVPLMAIVAVPVTIVICRCVSKRLNVLVKGMENVAGGDLDTYLPTARAGDFSSIYENFNKMVAELQSVQVLKSDMVDMLSHELKTPIASINGFARLLLEEDLSEEKREKYLAVIVKEADRLSLLTKNVLLLSKLDSQEIVASKKPYDLRQQLRDCAISLESVWSAKNIDLTAELDEAVYEGDADLMESLWLNLIGNAVKFTPKNGEVTIRLTAEKDVFRVSVSDTGPGMSEEVRARLFEKYYQGDKTFSSTGHGLGLTIAKRVAHLAGGTIEAESREGEGSTFTVTLPR